jgi:hypothetical protein
MVLLNSFSAGLFLLFMFFYGGSQAASQFSELSLSNVIGPEAHVLLRARAWCVTIRIF